jgi:dephospho-CoA kinase
MPDNAISSSALKVGLTGGIGSGKTVVARIFQLLGVPVYFADDAARELYHRNEDLKASIIHHFGEESYIDGKLDRPRLARIVFGDAQKLQLLNSLVHPLTIEDARQWMEQQQAPYLIKEAALLFESGSADDLDLVIGVSAPVEVRIRRVMERDGVGREEVLQRINRQLDEDTKMARCRFVIRNNEEEALIPQVLHLHGELLRLASQSKNEPYE